MMPCFNTLVGLKRNCLDCKEGMKEKLNYRDLSFECNSTRKDTTHHSIIRLHD